MSRDYLIGEKTPKNQYALGCERVLRGGRVIKMTYPILLSTPATARGDFSKRSLYQCNPCNPWSKEKGRLAPALSFFGLVRPETGYCRFRPGKVRSSRANLQITSSYKVSLCLLISERRYTFDAGIGARITPVVRSHSVIISRLRI